jgi:hypothetical protein
MPYIREADRQQLGIMCLADTFLSRMRCHAASSGELNYIITKLLLTTQPQTYEDFNSLIGVLECCKLEFYRRAVAVYEDKKIQENGDIYAGT